MTFSERIQNAGSLAEIFELVKIAAWKVLRNEQAGLMLGLADMPTNGAWLGAFYSPEANTIIMNKLPLRKIRMSSPGLFNPYAFHILLHEYIHSLGCYDEQATRQLTYEVSRQLLGNDHIATQLAVDVTRFLENIGYADLNEHYFTSNIEFINGVDRRNTDYIM
jgi:hypothetical protein